MFVALKLWPGVRGYLPVGGVEQLISQPTKNPLQASEAVRAAHVANLGQSIFWLVVAIVSAILVSLPVSWVYMAVRAGNDYDQSLVNTIIVLPMIVTGIVIIVQNSLALAFLPPSVVPVMMLVPVVMIVLADRIIGDRRD